MPVSNDDLSPIFEQAGREWNVDPDLLRSVATQETGGMTNPDFAVSRAGAQGRMQFIPSTAKKMGITNPSDPVQSIYGSAKYLSQLLDKYHNPALAAAAYNAGSDRVDAFLAGKGPLPAETNAYVPGVVSKYQARTAANRPQPQTPTNAPDPFTAAMQDQPEQTAQPPQNDPFTRAMGGPLTLEETAGTPQTPAATSTEEPTTLDKIGAGLNRAAHDITDIPAEYLAKGADAIGLTPLLNRMGVTAPTGAQTAQNDAAALNAYNQNYGNSSIAAASRIGGQLAATVPMLATGEGILGGAADIASAGAGRVAPWLGRAVENTANFLGGTTGGNALARGASLAANGALQGGAASALTAGQSNEPVSSQMLSGAGMGAVAGPVAGAIGAGIRAAGNALAGGVEPEVANLAKIARDKYDIPVTVPQMSDNSLIRTANEQSAKLPFSGAGANAAAQQTAWQKAVMAQMGENATKVTPDVMNRAATRIGQVFQDVANRTNIQVDPSLMNELGRVESDSALAPLGDSGAKAIKSQIDNIMDTAAKGNGIISGQDYQQLTAAGSPLQRAEHAGDPNVRYYASQIRDALDGAFQRSAAPDDQAALTKARSQWRAMKTIEDLVEKSPDGNLNPALLLGQVRNASSRFDSSTGGMAYTGGGNLGELAQIGQRFLKSQPNSGTADRLIMNSLLGGGTAGGLFVNPIGTAVGVPAGLAANRMIGSAIRSGPYADAVIRNSLNGAFQGGGSQALPYAGIAAMTIPNPLSRRTKSPLQTAQ